ncbi:MAG TPA: HAMP domain-containing sensor histidine kinase [Beutenbergiaceae bacterium]|nr:HAMP domain-containing sensor histidine kinase [Beutenbergiaceae bacterium]
MRGHQWGFAAHLLVAIAVVVLVGWLTAGVIAAVMGPRIFHNHMIDSQSVDNEVVYHAELAFRHASVLSLSVALVAALIASIVVSIMLTRRVTGLLSAVTSAAREVAEGDHSARVPLMNLGRQFDELAEAFNSMGVDLAEVETTRTRMLGDLAHELRTPLAIIGGYLQAIRDRVRQADEDTLVILQDQVERLTRLSEDISLVTTEQDQLTMRHVPVPVTTLLAGAYAQAKAQFQGQGVAFDLQVGGMAQDAVLEADPDRLGQVLTNLVDNALHHTSRGERVVLSADREGSWIVIRVSDDGDGIASEHLPHLFNRFYRVDTARDRTRGGSGVGLAIVRAITRAHGGSVTASSAGPGSGATFTLRLPLC